MSLNPVACHNCLEHVPKLTCMQYVNSSSFWIVYQFWPAKPGSDSHSLPTELFLAYLRFLELQPLIIDTLLAQECEVHLDLVFKLGFSHRSPRSLTCLTDPLKEKIMFLHPGHGTFD
ncbi:hypothetical protein BgiBS90_001834 [Biomphalaria glabrata]|nr:hypothetical protein BgiBS90_001834 [Biomphalaria glabrata]